MSARIAVACCGCGSRCSPGLESLIAAAQSLDVAMGPDAPAGDLGAAIAKVRAALALVEDEASHGVRREKLQ